MVQIAARTLGDLVRKLGEKILPEIIPILEEGLRSDKSDERQGVCIGLSEIMKSTSKDAVSQIAPPPHVPHCLQSAAIFIRCCYGM